MSLGKRPQALSFNKAVGKEGRVEKDADKIADGYLR